MAGIGVVFNPRAGKNKRDPQGPARLARRLGDHGLVAAPRSIDELLRTAEEFKRQRIEVLGIAGGDGTNHVTLTNFHRVYGSEALPTVALLRGGTMNTVANALRLPGGRTDGLLDRLVLKYLSTPTLPAVEQWTMNVEGQLGFLWGIGAVAGFLKEYYDTGAPSPWTAVKTLARGIGSAAINGAMVRRMTRPVRLAVQGHGLEGDSRAAFAWGPREFFTVAAGTIPDIGLGFRPFYRAHESEGRGHFHLLGVTTGPLGFVAELPNIHAARPLRRDRAQTVLAHELTVRGHGPLRYMIDGDLFEHPASEMTVRIGPSVRIATMN